MRRSHEGLRGIIKDHYLNLPKELEETLYLIFDYPYKYYTFKHFEV